LRQHRCPKRAVDIVREPRGRLSEPPVLTAERLSLFAKPARATDRTPTGLVYVSYANDPDTVTQAHRLILSHRRRSTRIARAPAMLTRPIKQVPRPVSPMAHALSRDVPRPCGARSQPACPATSRHFVGQTLFRNGAYATTWLASDAPYLYRDPPPTRTKPPTRP